MTEYRGHWHESPDASVPVLTPRVTSLVSHLWATGTTQSPSVPGWSAPSSLQAGSAYHHGLERDLLIVVNSLLPVVGIWVAETSDVHHVAEVEGQGDGQQACGRLLRDKGWGRY